MLQKWSKNYIIKGLSVLSVFFIQLSIYAQTFINISSREIKELYNRTIDAEDFKPEIINKLVFLYVNTYRAKERLDTFTVETILNNASEDHAQYMAKIQKVTLDGEGKKKNTSDRLKYYGGSGLGTELVISMPISKGNEMFTYGKIADDIGFKWLNDKKALDILQSTRYVLVGIGSALDVDKKKIYLSMTFGNYTLFNNGAALKDQLKVPYTTKKYGLKPYDNKLCRRCDKFRNIESLYDGIYVKDGNVYFKYNHYKQLKKILKDPTDGIAIDFIQKEQYLCHRPNIVDFSRVNKGIMLKPLKSKKIEKKNLIQDKNERKKRLNVLLGSIPSGIDDNYEINLLIINGKSICKVITPSFEDEADIVFAKEIELLADTILFNAPNYVPIVEKAHLEFIIPFERNKFDYKPEDIEPLINKLDEPNFVINKLQIEAFTSIEGTDQANKELQNKRAQSIVNALRQRQKSKFITNIRTATNIEDFKRDITGTEWAHLASMDIKSIQNYINSHNLEKKLEPILQKHRYARIKMDVTYKLDNDNEEKYVLNRFNKSIKENNLTMALSIQKYIFKKVVAKKFSKEAVIGQQIPEKPEYAGLLMNKLWLEKYVNNDELNEDYCNRIAKLYKFAPENFYIRYNHYYCKILFDNFTNEKQMIDFQRNISSLYNSGLKHKTVDILNLEYQFKKIRILDTLETSSPFLEATLDTIKAIVKLTESNWQNSLKLAYIFMSQKDYEFAAKLIEPYINKDNVFDELIFTYLSICSHLPHKYSSPKFTMAIKKAAELDPDRLCILYKKKKLSFQSLENPYVKEVYCKTCKN